MTETLPFLPATHGVPQNATREVVRVTVDQIKAAAASYPHRIKLPPDVLDTIRLHNARLDEIEGRQAAGTSRPDDAAEYERLGRAVMHHCRNMGLYPASEINPI